MTTTRLLLVEPSATMRFVLSKHAESLGFTVDVVERYTDAANALQAQYQSFGHDYACVLLGWPSVPDDAAASFANLLEQDEFNDMAVVVLSTDMRAETRAWVAGRDNTAVVAWKHYLKIEPKLSQLLGARDTGADIFETKFDNRDIQILVVDDSATIRHSLKELFSMQGYRVSLAASSVEAMKIARTEKIDIAVLDFYLAETTGDVLCRDLIADPDTHEVTCTVLTGTYSDHIIKRSLRAGAVECMFKNESSELLLNRIDAISRFVRQRRILENDRMLLDDVVDSIAGPTIVLNHKERIVYLSQLALRELELDTAAQLLGQAAAILLGQDKIGDAGRTHDARWRRPDGSEVSVQYVRRDVAESSTKVISFSATSTKQGRSANDRDPATVANVASTWFGLTEAAQPFLQQLQAYLNDAAVLNERVSLLLVDVFLDGADGLTSIDVDETLAVLSHQRIMGIYRRRNHVLRIAPNRYAFVFRHKNESQILLLTRKIMQICNDSTTPENKKIASVGSLVGINERGDLSASELLQLALNAVEIVPSKGADQVYLMDLHQMLSVYPS